MKKKTFRKAIVDNHLHYLITNNIGYVSRDVLACIRVILLKFYTVFTVINL